MRIELSEEMIAALTVEKLAPFGATPDKLRWAKSFTVNLADVTRVRLSQLRALLAAVPELRGAKQRLADVDTWAQIVDGEKVKCRKLKDWDGMLKQHLKSVPGHWIWEKREHADVYQPYYVGGISYFPPKKTQYGYVPAYVQVHLYWEELGKCHSHTDTYHSEDVVGMSVARALAERGYVTETPALRAAYDAAVAKYVELYDKIGRQYAAVGVGVPEKDDTDYDRYWYRKQDIRLDRDGVPARVVVDVLSESDKATPAGKKDYPSGEFWRAEPIDHDGHESDDDTDLKPGDEDDDAPLDMPPPAVPLAPAVMCFDLRRQTRVKIYVDQMTRYEYRTDLADKLILPAEVRDLVDMLVAHRGGFKDVIGGKGGGAIILCAGPPGTGKTLTSEVYSEAMSRPLYSVQCSQLGLDPDKLEKELLKVFTRAARWGAILLLDEADVYVAARGSDLHQNAIVGVFLRVLEYYAGVLFMTTNRADLVDDAVASRCLARIDYAVPGPADQKRIWRTLAGVAEIALADREIDKIVAALPGLSGRDVKNLLKLASLVAAARGVPVTAEVVKFVKQFKPTSDPESR